MEPMYYTGLGVYKRKISYCVKDSSGKLRSEGSIPATRYDWTAGSKSWRMGHIGQALEDLGCRIPAVFRVRVLLFFSAGGGFPFRGADLNAQR